MSLFGLGKKKEKTKTCCCGGNCDPKQMNEAENTKQSTGIIVLGGGCSKCHELEANAKAALDELGSNESLELITDFAVIATYGVMTTPALVVDGKVVSYGKVLKTKDIVEKIKELRE